MGSGRLTASGEILLYSGWDYGQHHEGVAIVSKKGVLSHSLLEWKSISSRLMRAKLKGKHNITDSVLCSNFPHNFIVQNAGEWENMTCPNCLHSIQPASEKSSVSFGPEQSQTKIYWHSAAKKIWAPSLPGIVGDGLLTCFRWKQIPSPEWH